MDLELAGKSAWVIGATGAIGRGICSHLAAEGARVAVTSRREDAVEELVGEIRAAGFELDYEWLPKGAVAIFLVAKKP